MQSGIPKTPCNEIVPFILTVDPGVPGVPSFCTSGGQVADGQAARLPGGQMAGGTKNRQVGYL